MWAFIALLSSFILGIYDIFKKIALKDNLVLSVLFFSSIFSALLFLPSLIFSSVYGHFVIFESLFIPAQNAQAHLFFFAKAVLVGSSWIFAYFAIKHLPVTITSTIRSSAPIWTLIGALILFGERLNFYQWAGIIIAVVFYYLFASIGKKEGIHFRKNKWIIFSIIATLLGSISSLYDKYLVLHFNRIALQAWFSIYMVAFLLPFFLLEKRFLSIKNTKFTWRWSIPLIGISLVLADLTYFWAISQQGALISMISALRRTSVVFTLIFAAILLDEKNIRSKFLILAGILFSVALIVYGSSS